MAAGGGVYMDFDARAKRHLRQAFERQLDDHQQCAARFIETIACLCDDEAYNGTTMAKTLRIMSSACHANGLTVLPLVQNSTPRGASFGLNPPQRADSKSPRDSKLVNNGSRKSLNSVDSIDKLDKLIDTSNFHSEFEVDKFPFITADGEIENPPSDVFRMLGPKAQERFKEVWHFLGKDRKAKKRGILYRFSESNQFKVASVLAITINYFFIIAQTNWRMANPKEEIPQGYKAIDLSLTVFYTFEVAIKLMALGRHFFFGLDWAWNSFDFIIVVLSLTQEMSGAIDTSFLRIFRFLRISRILRMFEAVRIFKEVKIMVDSLIGSFIVFLSGALMLALYLSVFAIFFVQGLTAKLEDEDSQNPMTLALKGQIEDDFGTVPNGMLSLFMALSGGVDWINHYDTIKTMGSAYSLLFIFFFCFAVIAFFNVVTGVFCEKAMSLARPGPHEMMVRKQNQEVGRGRAEGQEGARRERFRPDQEGLRAVYQGQIVLQMNGQVAGVRSFSSWADSEQWCGHY